MREEQMITEELAMRAKAGDRAAEEALYFRVKPLLHRLAKRYLSMCRQARMSQEDLQQELYFAFRSAVYLFAPEKGYCFTTYLRFPVQTVCRAAIGIRDGRVRETPLSLEEPIGEESTLGDLIADERALPEEEAALAELRATVCEAVEQLPEPQRSLVAGQYFAKKTLEELAAQLGLEPSKALRLKREGLRLLRRNRAIRALRTCSFPRIGDIENAIQPRRGA